MNRFSGLKLEEMIKRFALETILISIAAVEKTPKTVNCGPGTELYGKPCIRSSSAHARMKNVPKER